MSDFSKFDKEIDVKQLTQDIKDIQSATPEYKEVPAGAYMCSLDKLEVGETKDGRPMLKAQFRIIGDKDGNKCDFTKNCLFMNRVIYGTKNDANMIASALGWLKSLEPSDDIVVEFKGYAKFADLVMDIAEDVAELQYLVDYDPDAFNNIAISAVYEN
jgi:hypothetical protein